MDKLSSVFLIILIILTLVFVYYFYVYLYKQYEKASINFYKKKEAAKEYYKTVRQFSQNRPIRNNVTAQINQDLINKRVGYAVIEFINEQGKVEKTQTVFKPNLSIGREESNDIVLYNQTISRRQCLIRYQNNKFYLCNLSDTNPTMLNGVFISNTRQLSFGDIIEISDYILRFSDIVKKPIQNNKPLVNI